MSARTFNSSMAGIAGGCCQECPRFSRREAPTRPVAPRAIAGVSIGSLLTRTQHLPDSDADRWQPDSGFMNRKEDYPSWMKRQ